jgi:hypothetical protein
VSQAALAAALKLLERHFQSSCSKLPFSYDLNIRQFRAVDNDFIRFIADVSGRRSAGGKYAKEFENAACIQLKKELPGYSIMLEPRVRL